MKDWIIALVLFSLMLTGITVHAIYVNQQTQTALRDIESLDFYDKQETERKLKDLKERWQSFGKMAKVTLNYSDVSRIQSLLAELSVHLRLQNEEDFETSKEMLLHYVQELARLESLRPEGIF